MLDGLKQQLIEVSALSEDDAIAVLHVSLMHRATSLKVTVDTTLYSCSTEVCLPDASLL